MKLAKAQALIYAFKFAAGENRPSRRSLEPSPHLVHSRKDCFLTHALIVPNRFGARCAGMRRHLMLWISALVFACSGAANASYNPPPGDFPPTWSADGRSVAYVSNRDPAGLHMFDLATGLNRLSDISPSGASDVSLSPDWQQLATIEAADAAASPRLVVQGLDGTGRRVLSDVGYWPVVWSPDGTQLAFDRPSSTNSGDLYTVGADGSPLTKIADQAIEPSWSPDGRQLAYSQRTGPSREDVVIANADGSNPRVLTAGLPDSHRQPSWSPDGKTIASVSWSGVWNIDFTAVASKDTRRFLARGFPANDVPTVLSWSPDSRMLVYSAALTTATTAPPAISRIDLSTDEEAVVIQSGAGATYSPDGTRIGYAAPGDCPSAGVYLLDLRAGSEEPRRLTNDCHAAATPQPTISVAPLVVRYGGSVTLRGWFPPGSATTRIRLIEFAGPPCAPIPSPPPTTKIVESVNGSWSYRFRPCANDDFNIYSDTAFTGARVRVAPRVRLARIGQASFDFTATAAARLGGNAAFVERLSKGRWLRIRRLRLTDRSTQGNSFTSGRKFVLHLSHRSRVRVFMPQPVINGNIFGSYMPATSNAVTG